MADTISLLKQYGEDVGGAGSSEGTLAFVAARWIAVDPTAISDPLLTDILAKAQFHSNIHKPTHTNVDSFLFNTKPTGKLNIMDYFGTAGTTSNTSNTSNTSRPRIYCDGACSANGRRGARAGFGGLLIHADGTEETVSEALKPSEQQTNQRAELRGLQWAFTKAMGLPEGADIYTDSEYAMKCFTEWGAGWAVRGWRKSDGKDVLHQDILKPMWEMWKHRGSKMTLRHVSAHTGRGDIHSKGNARADILATSSIN